MNSLQRADGEEVVPKQDLGLSNALELVMKIGAAFLALTYMSGYLIVNTHLSSFGISDSADLFKAKYIYVGFLYLLFMFVVILLFAVVKKIWDLKEMLFPRSSRKDTRPKTQPFAATQILYCWGAPCPKIALFGVSLICVYPYFSCALVLLKFG